MKKLLLLPALLCIINLNAQPIVELSLIFAEETPNEKIYDLVVEDADSLVAAQFSMVYDSTRMRFKEIRNSAIGMNASSIFEPLPGSLVVAWIDFDFGPGDYPNPALMGQLVFNMLAPGGSTLCFSDMPVEYEFEVYVDSVNSVPADLIINDDCVTNLFIRLTTTAVSESDDHEIFPEKLFLSRQGELVFTIADDQSLEWVLYDITGRTLASINQTYYSPGRHSIYVGRPLSEGIYFLQVRNEEGGYVAYPVIAR